MVDFNRFKNAWDGVSYLIIGKQLEKDQAYCDRYASSVNLGMPYNFRNFN